ncbi:SphA family protein [Rhodoplanes serenus]|uniref:SphA family protein n=1 Tax=Rhodoplanes serenus TaxID=200615 RepID=UPI000DAE11B1|nr:transporter [Rhodoplanes serenus]RAI31116.1 hypothetical protein CH340_19620 [Rhodoplanes serenus]
MFKPKSLLIGIGVAAGLAGSAAAYEPGVHEATRTGITLGVPAGASPPPGLYLNLNTFYYDVNIVDRNGKNSGIHDTTAAPTAIVMWVPGWQLFGAAFNAYVAQPFVWNTAELRPTDTLIRDELGLHNTFVSPINLSWTLGNGWFTSVGFGFYVPTGTVTDALAVLPPTAGTGGPGLDFWTFQPRWAVTHLGSSYNFTANLYYEINTKNRRSEYTSGDVFYADVTLTRKIGKFEVGPVAAVMLQTTGDTDPLGLYTTPPFDPIGDRRSKQVALGALFGYDFGPMKLNLIVTADAYARSTGSGWQAITNWSVPLWTPAPAAKPALLRK